MFKARTIAGPLGGAACIAAVIGVFAITLGGARSAEPAVALPAPALGEAGGIRRPRSRRSCSPAAASGACRRCSSM